MTWSYSAGVLTSTGATKASPDPLLAGIAIVQAADATRGYRNGQIAWVNNLLIRTSGTSFIKHDDDATIVYMGTSGIQGDAAGNITGGFIGGACGKALCYTTNTGNWRPFGNGSTFITQRRNPQDPAFSFYQMGGVRVDFPTFGLAGTGAFTLAEIDINGLDLYANTQGNNLLTNRIYLYATGTVNVRDVRCFNRFGDSSLTLLLAGGTYQNLYYEALYFGSEQGLVNTVNLVNPTFYRSSPSFLEGLIRASTFVLTNPTFLNNCWNGAANFIDMQLSSKWLLQYTFTNQFKIGLSPVEGVSVRLTRARQSVNGSPTWAAPNAVLTATSNAQGTFTALNLLDTYREGLSTTDIERFNWTAKARSHNRRTAAENIFTNRVFYQGSANMSAGYSEEVQMLDLAYAPATLADGLAITGVAFDSAGNCTLTENRTALEIFQAWCSASRNNLDMPDVWRYDGTTLTMGAANLSGTGTATGQFVTTGTITAPVNGTYTDANNAGQIVVTGPEATDTVEMRRASDNSLIATRTGPGAFAVSPANVGVSVYFERKVGTVLVMSTQTTPVTLSTVNDDVPMFAGPQVAVANVDGIAKEATLLQRPTLAHMEASAALTTTAPTAAQIRTELESTGSKLDTAAKKSKSAWVNTL